VRTRLLAVGLGERPAIHDRHAHVQQDHVDVLAGDLLESDRAVVRRRDTVTLVLEDERDKVTYVSLIFNYEHVFRWHYARLTHVFPKSWTRARTIRRRETLGVRELFVGSDGNLHLRSRLACRVHGAAGRPMAMNGGSAALASRCPQ
jgi:hypothetical protein